MPKTGRTWGGRNDRNFVSDEKGLPIENESRQEEKGSEDIDLSTTKNVALGGEAGLPVLRHCNIAGGVVFVGTNNESRAHESHIGDRGVVMCFDEYTGAFKWQIIAPKLGAGKVSDWEFLGMCSTPTIVGNKGYCDHEPLRDRVHRSQRSVRRQSGLPRRSQIHRHCRQGWQDTVEPEIDCH